MAGNAGRYSDGYVAVGVPPPTTDDVLILPSKPGPASGKDPAQLTKCALGSTSYHPVLEQALEGAGCTAACSFPRPTTTFRIRV